MRTRLASLALLGSLGLAGILVPGDLLRFAPEQGSELSKSFETALEVVVESFEVRANDAAIGINIKFGEVAAEDLEGDLAWNIAVRDVFVAVEGGRPRELKRRYEDLGASYEWNHGEEGGVSAKEELEGVEVLFRWNDEEESYALSFAEGSPELDPEWRAILAEDMDLRPLLPPDEVEVGASWKVAYAELQPVLFPGLHPRGLQGGPPFEIVPAAFLDLVADGMEEQSFEVTYRGTKDDLARLGLTSALHTTIDCGSLLDDEAVVSLFLGAKPTGIELTLDLELAGELLWDRTRNHFRSMELKGKGYLEFSWTALWEMNGEELELSGEGELALDLTHGAAAE